jgi:hypothetical protein
MIASRVIAVKKAAGDTTFSSAHPLHLGAAAMDYAAKTGSMAATSHLGPAFGTVYA